MAEFITNTKSAISSTSSDPIASSSGSGLVEAFDTVLDPTKGVGEKGAVEYSYSKILENASATTESFQRSLMALSNSSIQGTTTAPYSSHIQETNLQAVLTSLPTEGSERKIALGLLMSLLFQIRDCRKEGKGKGARDPFIHLFNRVVSLVPEIKALTKPLLALTPQYGYWKDIISVWSNAHDGSVLYESCLDLFSHQLQDDQTTVMTSSSSSSSSSSSTRSISLAGKWAPSEGKKYGLMAKGLAQRIFKTGTFSQKMKAYRSLLSSLRTKIGVTEQLMCAKKFSEIKFNLVPGVCLNRHRLAWDNKTKNHLERSSDSDRITAKANYQLFLESLKAPESKGAKGTSVFLHELASQIMSTSDDTELALLEAQWRDHEKMIRKHSEKTGFGLESMLCVADVSGSMEGTPMMVAIALSVMVARLQTGSWKGRILTFHEKPSWVILQDDWSIKKCLDHVRRAPWGGTTNFIGTHELILEVMRENKLSGSDLPKALMVISDMQFDHANRVSYASSVVTTWKTTHETLSEMYVKMGEEVTGEAYQLPLMIYWNVRGDTGGMPVSVTEVGALMVSGFSTNLLKLFLEQGIDSLQQFTPWKLLFDTLTDSHYQDVWNVMF